MPPKTKRVKKSRKAQAPKIQPAPGRPKYPVSKKDMSWTEPAKDEPTKDVANPLALWHDASKKARAKMKKDQLIALIKTKKYHFMKVGDEWDIMPNAEMKRQSVYGYNKKTKSSTQKTYKKKK